MGELLTSVWSLNLNEINFTKKDQGTAYVYCVLRVDEVIHTTQVK